MKAWLVIRNTDNNPDHHISLSHHGVWMISLTFYLENGTSRRERRSLQTKDINKARKIRDAILESIKQTQPINL